MQKLKQYSNFHRKIFWSVSMTVLALVISFIVVLYVNEKNLKEDILTTRLTAYNDYLDEQIQNKIPVDSAVLNIYSRTTIFNPEGEVIFDSKEKDYTLLSSQYDWQEIRHAREEGTGFDIRRRQEDIPGTYFYFATRYNDYIIRSALPFELTFWQVMGNNVIYFTLLFIILIVLGIIYYRVMFRLGENINRLNDFAMRADRDEALEYSDQFSKNELGEISQHIVQIYNRLMQTKKALVVEKERVIQQQEEQVRIKKQLTQNIAHELKTPVSSIQGYLETIVNNKDMQEEVKDNFIAKGYAQCKRLSSLLHDITYLSRIDEAPEMIEKEQLDISEVISGVLNDIVKQLEEKKITVHNSTENQELICYGSISLLYSIFRNLFDNTIAYAGEGVEIFVDCYKEDATFYYFSYSDNGVGVSEEHLPRIFERFYRLDKGRSRKLGGTGLGLAIVKNSVLFHGGHITAKRLYGGGLEFVFTIRKKA